MQKVQARTTKLQKSATSVRRPARTSARPNQQKPVQLIAPYAVSRRAQVNQNGLTPADLLGLQRTVGNRGVQRMVTQWIDDANAQQPHAHLGENSGGKLQAKLTVGVPNARYGQAANRAANQVQRRLEPRSTEKQGALQMNAGSALGTTTGNIQHFLGTRSSPSRIQRQTLKLRNGHEVGVASPGPTTNIKKEAVDALTRLMDLWAIDVPTYDQTMKTTWKSYGPDDAIGASDLKPLTDAITKSEDPTLAAAVANNFLALNPPITDSVGVGSINDPKDVTAVQNALIAHRFLNATSASGKVDAATATAIKQFKRAVAAATFGLNPLRANEQVDGRDRFAGGTFQVAGDPITLKLPPEPAHPPEPAKPARTDTLNKTFTVYVPRKAPANKNKVHLFFTPLPDELKFVNEQGLRAEHENSEWILIAVPGLFEAIQPNFVTISTAEIQRCLSSIKRASTTIDSLRLSAHSRGHRGLEHTMGLGGVPTINLNLVERVTVFDASYADIGTTLKAHTKDLTRMQDPTKKTTLASGTVNLYDVTVGNVSGVKGKQFDVSGIRALAYIRFVKEGLELGKIDKIDIATLKKNVQDATNRLLAVFPIRGGFSTRSPTPPGKQDLTSFLATNKTDLALVDDSTNGLTKLITAQNLDLGYQFDLNPKDPHRSLSAHHWLAAELGHESVD